MVLHETVGVRMKFLMPFMTQLLGPENRSSRMLLSGRMAPWWGLTYQRYGCAACSSSVDPVLVDVWDLWVVR